MYLNLHRSNGTLVIPTNGIQAQETRVTRFYNSGDTSWSIGCAGLFFQEGQIKTMHVYTKFNACMDTPRIPGCYGLEAGQIPPIPSSSSPPQPLFTTSSSILGDRRPEISL